MAFSEHRRWIISVLIEDQSWVDCIDITSRWDTFVSFHLYGNKGVSLPLWPIRPRWFHTFSPCAEPLGDGHEGMWARFGSQGSIALNWHSRYSGTRYSGTWLYFEIWPWNIQGHEWGQRSRSHIVPSIQPMHFLFVSHHSDQPFLRYCQNSVDLEKTHPNFLKKIGQNYSFQQNFSKI